MTSEKKPHFTLPAADCHFHIVDPQRFPLAKGRGYQPRPDEVGTFKDFSVCMQTHDIRCGLAVQPSGYGYDNAALLNAVRCSGGRLKGIAVVPPGIGADELQKLKTDGIVGVRFNLVDFDPAGLAKNGAVDLLEAARAMDWFAEIQCSAKDFIRIEPLIRRTGVRILIDHLGRPDPQLGPEESGFKAILALADTGLAVVKLSGAFRESHRAYPFADLDPFVEAILKSYTTENCVWGSDWPFLNMDPKPDYGSTLACLERWLPDEDQRRKVLWHTPAKLFGFKPAEE
jgi:predicted TIM-barrel fold metal-dependent hydrolase